MIPIGLFYFYFFLLRFEVNGWIRELSAKNLFSLQQKEKDEELKNMPAIVTGGAQGMGFAIAKTLAYEGAKVAICDINGDKAAKAAENIINEGYEAISIQVDVTKETEVNKMVQTVMDKYGDICILVNNAGVLRSTKFDNITLQEWNFVLDINLTGSFL